MECIHRWQVDNNNIGTCSQCGEVRQFPWEKGPVIVLKKADPCISQVKEEHMNPNMERHRYYEDNKEAIIADLLSVGREATRKKWNIPVGGVLPSLEKRWLTQEQRSAIPTRHRRTKAVTPPPTNPTPSNGRLPPFPQFSATWDPSIQVKWLEVYRELATKEKSTVATTP
jgi:hypothetical protein